MSKSFNIADMFEMVVDAAPDREALVCGDYRTTLKEFDDRSTRLAHYLSSRGIKAGDHIGLFMHNCGEYLEGMMACFKIRAVPINVNYRYVGDELAYIFTNANMVGCIHGREFIPSLKEIMPKVPAMKTFICVNDDTRHDLAITGSVDYNTALQGQSTARDFGPRSDDDMFILYTGGTTGYPKGVMWPHKNVFFAAMSGGGAFTGKPCEKPEDIVGNMSAYPISGIALAPLMHGASWWYACIMLMAGNKLVLNHNRRLNGEQVWDIVEKEKLNLVQIVGDAMAIPLLDALKKHPGRWNLSSVFNIGSGGAVFSDTKQQEFKQAFPNCFITNAFGSSESGQMGSDSGSKKGSGDSSGLGNVVKSPFMDVIVTEGSGAPRHAKPGETGIFSRSGYIPRGYYNDEKKTAETFINVNGTTWLLTGDSAKLEDDGLSITIFGRGSNCINSGGEKIFPEEVEQAIKAHPDIYDCLVVATPHERWGNQVTAVISTRNGARPTLEEIQKETRKYIADYKVPRQLHFADEIIRQPNGKPDYKWAKQYALDGKGLDNTGGNPMEGFEQLDISTKNCRIEKKGHVLLVTLARPEAKNALSSQMLLGMYNAWRRLDEDKNLRVAILTGEGDTFCAGMDLKSGTDGDADAALFQEKMKEVPDLHWQALLRHRQPMKPVVMAVEGYALAGGTEILQGTDIRVAAEDAIFGVTECKRGLFPLGGSTIRLRRQIPYALAAEILLLGRHITAREAKEWGLVNRVVPKGKALAEALKIAEEIANENAPLSVQAILKSLRENQFDKSEKDALAAEEQLGWAIFGTKDSKEGMKAFKEKRKPNFIGE